MWKLRLDNESHGLTNLLCDSMLRLETCGFAAYKVPHPLSQFGEVTFSAKDETDARATIVKACALLMKELDAVQSTIGPAPQLIVKLKTKTTLAPCDDTGSPKCTEYGHEGVI